MWDSKVLRDILSRVGYVAVLATCTVMETRKEGSALGMGDGPSNVSKAEKRPLHLPDWDRRFKLWKTGRKNLLGRGYRDYRIKITI